jgi:small-conductance mechanosensitive channel
MHYVSLRPHVGHSRIRDLVTDHRGLFVMATIDICDSLGLPVGSLVAPAAALGAALGIGGSEPPSFVLV